MNKGIVCLFVLFVCLSSNRIHSGIIASIILNLILGMTPMCIDLLKDLYSTAPKRGSVFIGLMTPDGAIWSRYQRTVLMR